MSVGAQTGANFWSYLRELMFFLRRQTQDWLCDLAFAVGILLYINELNVMLQRKDQFLYEMYTNVRAFKRKLSLFSKQMSNKSFASHFPTLVTLKEAPRQVQKYRKSQDLHGKFCQWFSDLEKLRSHFSWCHDPSQNILKQCQKSCR